ncbi:MAG: acyl carrier protein [Muribaculaceae bacterium]|nr:acyl carrier protein [Muribaculaceae bacterium]
MKKDNKKRRKATIGAVLAAGMTTGALVIGAGNSANAINAEKPDLGLTAADMVMIDGHEVTVGDMASPDNRRGKTPIANPKKTMYGPRPRVYGPRPPQPTPKQLEQSQDRNDSIMITYYVKYLLLDELNLDVVSIDSISSEARFVEDLGADSLNIADILIAIEKKYEITIPDEKLEQLTTVGQLIDYLREEVKNKRLNGKTL